MEKITIFKMDPYKDGKPLYVAKHKGDTLYYSEKGLKHFKKELLNLIDQL
jgi:hypothetical protein